MAEYVIVVLVLKCAVMPVALRCASRLPSTALRLHLEQCVFCPSADGVIPVGRVQSHKATLRSEMQCTELCGVMTEAGVGVHV